MAIGVNPSRAAWSTPLALAVAAVLPFAAVAAGEAALPDPTRPPEGMVTFSAPGAMPPSLEPQLQSVLTGAAGRSAIIGGQRYKLGDRVGDARLVKISENEVVLSGPGGRRTMKLFVPVKTRVADRDTTLARRSPTRNP